MVKEIKSGVVNSEGKLSDKSTVPTGQLKSLKKIAKSFGLRLTREQVAAAAIPNSPAGTTAYSWMLYYFKLVGDFVPNAGGEIHLEPTTIVEIHKEYELDMNNADVQTISIQRFGAMWLNCFRHVKIREFKAVAGKCDCCAKLSTTRRGHKSDSGVFSLLVFFM
jgi:hypothetical protein